MTALISLIPGKAALIERPYSREFMGFATDTR
jgi:hypothetical protein